ncbi:monofunctional biosynthetic peptidoglycan transglycosylase [Immundisolibacter sp.]|uniref:monofunctional biosynthetic peptidoglycan transglycosylase n=1 Tax=Immundisolibacter sp. TaxID=1934948 RepID=UPI00260497E6|nr:monofunctional biosynthetic peptidoglycan transglycosylase [Immundisolibacter sp.]MDD3650542.1 monofunctional biosynthetic peptidoglycan transglycosylase [Immundisolibacter sp.]
MSRIARARRWLRRVVNYALLTWLVVTVGSVLLLRWLPPPTTSFILQNRIAAMRAGYGFYPYPYHWVDYQNIAPVMALAVIAAEDQNFRQHHGLDLSGIRRAIRDNQYRDRPRGASTITQQTAKNLFLWRGQSWLRKGVELYFTGLLELLWPKQRILEVYLNVAQFGGSVFGVEAAARTYFNCSAAQLTREQAALLAAVLPSPSLLHVDAPSDYLRQRQRWVLNQMRRLGPGYLQGL